MTTAKEILVSLALVLIIGCSGTTNRQLPMSGTDPNYPQSGVFTGEDGRGLIYSSDWRRVKDEEAAAAENAAIAGLSEAERAEFEAWKAQQESAEVEAWKKSREQQAGSGQAADSQ